MKTSRAKLDEVRTTWEIAWPDALGAWSRFTKLSLPRWCVTVEDEKEHGLSDSFAMIRLNDQAVVVSLSQVIRDGLESFAKEVLAHEIGHHIYVPANLLEHGRMLARMRRGLPDREVWAPMVANLYADLLINDRLQRSAGLDIAGVYKKIRGKDQSPLWQFYLRTYEVLWSLPTGTLVVGKLTPEIQADAALAARVVRSFASEWLEGTGRYAVLCLTYLLQDKAFDLSKVIARVGGWCDTVHAGQGAVEVPAGLIDIDDGEAGGIIHPMFDPEISGVELNGEQPHVIGKINATSTRGNAPGQCREPFEYGQILKALGLNLSDHDVAVRYYRERAVPYLVKFPVKMMPQAAEPLAEGLETWEFGRPLEEIDWTESVLASPLIVPGVTTRQRVWGVTAGADPATRPIDLDIYVDCSGSMPNPQNVLSPVALAGAIITLSALRVGSAVQATLWSGARQFQTTGGFVRDPAQILRILTGYIGGATAFPIHFLRDTYANRKITDRAVHVLIVSDDGVTTMFDKDERNTSGWDVSTAALAAGRGGGTMVLNLWNNWTEDKKLVRANQQGWDIHVVRTLEDLLPFAREFSRHRYEQKAIP